MAYTEQVGIDVIRAGNKILFNGKLVNILEVRQLPGSDGGILAISVLVSFEGRSTSFWLRYTQGDQLIRQTSHKV